MHAPETSHTPRRDTDRRMRYGLLAIDLDGTLFDSFGQVSTANREAVQRARDAGVLVALCTGRGLVESRPAIEALGHDGPIILAGGALVSDPTTGKTLHRAVIEPHLAAEIIDALNPTRHAVLLLPDPAPQEVDYIVVGADNLTTNTRWWFETIGARVRCVDRPSERDLHHALRVGIVGPESAMSTIADHVKTRFGERVVVQHFMAVKQHDGEDVHVFEVFAAGVNKWAGIEWLAREHGIGLDAVAAIGDHINDVAMVAAAPCGIAMGNAVPEVLAVADYVTASNDADGVAEAIDRMLAGEW